MTEPCRFCGSKLIKRHGARWGKRLEQYQCSNLKCRKYQSLPPRHPVSAKILLLDIETLPMEAFVWSPKQDWIQPSAILKDWSISCWAAKWLFEPEIMGQVVSSQEAISRNESSILENMWGLLNTADIVITQNGIEFDIKKLFTKFLIHGYPPPSPFKNIDTLKVAKSVFGFTYNSLNELAKQMGIGVKKDMGFSNWRECAAGNPEELQNMLIYCKQDVAPLLEDVYLTMRPWVKGHPNLNLFTDHNGDVCPKCESNQLKWDHQYATPQGLWNGFRCQACGATGRGTSKGKDGHKEKGTQIVPT